MTERNNLQLADTMLSRWIKIAFICWDVLTSTVDTLTSEVYYVICVKCNILFSYYYALTGVEM